MVTQTRTVRVGRGPRALLADESRLVTQLQKIAHRLRAQVVRHGAALERLFPGFADRFIVPIKRITAFHFAVIGTGAAYVLDEAGVMTVNVSHIVGMLARIADDVEADALVSPAERRLAPTEFGRLMRLAVEVFLLHEIRHISQGISEYGTVQKLKAASAKPIIGTLDLIADRDAAYAYALLQSIEARDISVKVYLQHFAEALFFGLTYGFPAFKVDQPHKTARALGIAMMLARVVAAQRAGTLEAQQESMLPLHTTLIPHIDPTETAIAVLATTPDLRLVTIEAELDRATVQHLCARLDSGESMPVLEETMQLMRSMRML